jgi:hypothetical protein
VPRDELRHLGATSDVEVQIERFCRSDRSRAPGRAGAGIGLTIVRELVRAHDGRVEVESEPGRRTSFRVVLPDSSTTRAVAAARRTIESIVQTPPPSQLLHTPLRSCRRMGVEPTATTLLPPALLPPCVLMVGVMVREHRRRAGGRR